MYKRRGSFGNTPATGKGSLPTVLWVTSGNLKMQDKMAAPNKMTDTRTELAELIKKRAEIAVGFLKISSYISFDGLNTSIIAFNYILCLNLLKRSKGSRFHDVSETNIWPPNTCFLEMIADRIFHFRKLSCTIFLYLPWSRGFVICYRCMF